MRALTHLELRQINGGTSYIDTEMWRKTQSQAIRDGFAFSMVTIPITMAMVHGLFASPVITMLSGTILAPYTVALGYLNSNAWDYFYAHQDHED